MIGVLSLIFLVLLLFVGRLKGLKIYLSFYINFVLIVVYITITGLGFDPVICAVLISLAVCVVSLFMINGNNIKTWTSFISICLVMTILSALIIYIGAKSSIQGFSHDAVDAISIYSPYINYNMTGVTIGTYMICVIGTIIDTSISISSSLNEVYINNKNNDIRSLFEAGMSIGRDILSTTINTLFFVFLGGIVSFFFWHYRQSFEFIINYKSFVQSVVELMFCFIGSISIIPVTAFITSVTLKRMDKFHSQKK